MASISFISCLPFVRKEDIQPACQRGLHPPRRASQPAHHVFLGPYRRVLPCVTAASDQRNRDRCAATTPKQRRHDSRAVLSFVTLLITALTSTQGPVCAAQSQDKVPEREMQNTGITPLAMPGVPTPAQAMSAFEELASLVVNLNLPGPDSFASAGSPSAASIGLRLDGQIIASVTTVGPACLHDATRQVIGLLMQRARVPEAVVRPENADGAAPPPPPHQRPLLPGLDTERIRVSLELAGPFVPITPTTLDDADQRLAPGLDGVAVRLGATTHAMFPGTMLTLNIGPGDGLASVIAKGAADPALGVRGNADGEPGTFVKARGASLYKFRAIHLANPDSGAAPVFLFRGGRVVREREITTAGLKSFADSMARNLVARRMNTSTRRGMVGTPLPTLGRFEQASASPVEQSLAALALARYSDRQVRDDPTWLASRTRAAEILGDLAAHDAGEPDPLDSVACAALAASVFDDTDNLGLPPEFDAGPLRAFVDRCRAKAISAGASIDSVPERERALVAFSLARRAAWTRNPDEVKVAERAVGSVLRSTPPSQLVNQMPCSRTGEAGAGGRDGRADRLRLGPARDA